MARLTRRRIHLSWWQQRLKDACFFQTHHRLDWWTSSVCTHKVPYRTLHCLFYYFDHSLLALRFHWSHWSSTQTSAIHPSSCWSASLGRKPLHWEHPSLVLIPPVPSLKQISRYQVPFEASPVSCRPSQDELLLGNPRAFPCYTFPPTNRKYSAKDGLNNIRRNPKITRFLGDHSSDIRELKQRLRERHFKIEIRVAPITSRLFLLF